MRMFISLIHWVRKEISFHWRETDETCWAFGAIFFYSSLTCLIALVLAPKDLSKANWGHHYLPCILSSSLISFLSPLELLMLHTVHSFDVEQMKRLFPGSGTCLCLPLPGWQISDFKFMMTIKENNRKNPPKTNKQQQQKRKKAGTFEHRDCGHCFWPCALLSLTYSQMNCESHYHACRSEIPKREECHLRTLPTVYVYAKNWLCCLMMWGFGKSKPRKVKRTLVCPGS